MKISRIIKVSRPRFWIYELGPYLIGTIGAVTFFAQFTNGSLRETTLVLELLKNPAMTAFFIYFLIPANILIYGINDIYDYETDKQNPKKTGYEDLLTPDTHKKVWLWIVTTNIPFFFFLPWNNLSVVITFFAFVFFASFYSAKPIRAKIHPVLDSFFSAGHYVATGVFSYLLAGGIVNALLTGSSDESPQLKISYILAGLFWAMAMHAYSAVPDIKADKSAGLETIATFFGIKGTIILCGLLYFLAGLLSLGLLGWWGALFTVVYIALMFYSYKICKDEAKLFRAYTWFPKLNTLIGFAIFWIMALDL